MNTLTIVGLGPGSMDLISAGAKKYLTCGLPVYFRTMVHPSVDELVKLIPGEVSSFDYVYEQEAEFGDVYAHIVDELLKKAAGQSIVYAVPGHPMVAETTVKLLCAKAPQCGVKLEIVPSMSGVEAIMAELGIDPTDGMAVLDGLSLPETLPIELPLLITQIYSRMVASEVKLKLMEVYPEEHPVTLIRAAGIPSEVRRETLPLYKIDQVEWIDHLTSLYVLPCQEPYRPVPYSIKPLVDVMARLRGDNGCPWDRKQTHDSLKRYLIEECYEVLDAITAEDDAGLAEELGDVLLQIVFHAQVAWERGAFDINDVMNGIVEKLIRRHPHVFGDVVAETPEAVSRNWDAIKRQEKAEAGIEVASRLDGVPSGLPALMAAEKLQSKAAKVGFDWTNVQDVWKKVKEEISEFEEAGKEAAPSRVRLSEELGDILFAIVNVARHLKLDPEMALAAANRKFKTRFRYIEKKAAEAGYSLEEMTLEEMDKLWDEAKAEEAAEQGAKASKI